MGSIEDIQWDTHEDLVIRDVHAKFHDRVIKLFMDQVFKNHKLYSILQLQDNVEEVKIYKRYLKQLLNNECSIAVVNENNEIVAVALVACMTKETHAWPAMRGMFGEGSMAELLKMRVKVYLDYARDNPDMPFDSLHLFEYYIPDGLRKNTVFMNKFFDAVCETGRTMRMPHVTFTALLVEEQVEIIKYGFFMLKEVLYALYRDKYEDRPFTTFRDFKEKQMLIFEREFTPLVPYYKMRVREAEHIRRVLEIKARSRSHYRMFLG